MSKYGIDLEKQGEQGQAMSEKLARLEYYKRTNANYIEIQQNTIDNLDKTLPKALLEVWYYRLSRNL